MQKQQHPVKKSTKSIVPKEWTSKSITVSVKKSHQKPLISVSPLNDNLFYTSSEDNTVRLWDLRLESSVKLIQADQFKQNPKLSISNCDNNSQNLLYVGFDCSLYSFDIRKESIFIKDVNKKTQQPHFDDISLIKFNSRLDTVAVADDQGDIRLYNSSTLQQTDRMDQAHTNICNSLDFMFPEKSPTPLLLSGGFDCRLIEWSVNDNSPLKEVDMNDIFAKYNIQCLNTMPFIHHIHCYHNTIILSLQSGHVIGTTWNEIKKPKFIMQANLCKIIQSRVFQYKNLTAMICLNGDKSFTIWDFVQREDGAPKFLQKYACPFEGTWIEPMPDGVILVAGDDPGLAIYKIKG